MQDRRNMLQDIVSTVNFALQEDVGSGDVSAQLIAPGTLAKARVITRESAVVCGRDWVDEVFRQVDAQVQVRWHIKDGERAEPEQLLLELEGPARSLLTGERAALNFLQLLSGTASTCRYYADLVAGTGVRLLDTRKTIPGLRTAQKYAVTCGGCHNHRIGLYDAFLIKENHITACGGIKQAIDKAHQVAPGKPVEVEVETLLQLNEALESGADIVMLDNFTPKDTVRAVAINSGKAKLEASGGITADNIRQIASTGVDYISLGVLTKHCRAIDLSMRLEVDL